MFIKRAHLQNFRRFTDLTIDLEGQQPSLVLLCGPNGSGKSSLFDAFRSRITQYYGGFTNDMNYYGKAGVVVPNGDQWNPERAAIEFHGTEPGQQVPQNAVYVRSAYRNEPEFVMNELRRSGNLLEGPQVNRMIDNDARVKDNYQRLIGQTIESVYGGEADALNGQQIRDKIVGELRDVIHEVFPDLTLIGPGDPLGGGTFRFTKGQSIDFSYMNLSGAEKAVFDILLDMKVKQPAYMDTVYCIDEPEAHVNPKIHGKMLKAMTGLLPDGSQLWLATHSVGMLREARDMQQAEPQSVAFIDFDVDFDVQQTLTPTVVDRQFWRRSLGVAFGDMAELVAPEQVFLCEGELTEGVRSDFDARCYRIIFEAAHPNTEFLGIGNDLEVQSDARGIGKAVEALAPGTSILRLIDRDSRSPEEVAEVEAAGVRVLGRRNLESYLLDEEVLRELCVVQEKSEFIEDLLEARRTVLEDSAGPVRGNPPDDLKPCKGQIFNAAKNVLSLTAAGNNADSFLRDTLAPLVRPGMAVYAELEADLFN